MGVNDPGVVPRTIEAGERSLTITWEDGLVAEIGYAEIRRSCRCAECVEEMTGRPLLDPGKVPDDIHPTAINAVGNYAVQILWSDGHSSGIFSFGHLRGLSPGPQLGGEGPKTG